jgi:hypothetical protein
MTRDSMRADSVAAQKEVAYLKTLSVGDIRRGVLIPALDVGMEWVCTVVEDNRWEFEGRFFGQRVSSLVIEQQAGLLTLAMTEAQ